MYDMTYKDHMAARPGRFTRFLQRAYLHWLEFQRAVHIGGNRCHELELDKKICRMKVKVLRQSQPWLKPSREEAYTLMHDFRKDAQ